MLVIPGNAIQQIPILRLRTLHRSPALLCALLSVLFICPQTRARTADPDLQKALAERAAFGADQIAALERGEPVVKVIPLNDPREVAVCGVIEIPSDPETALKAFSDLKQSRPKEPLQRL